MKLVIRDDTLKDVIRKCVGSVIEKVFIGIGTASNDVTNVVEVFECPNIADNPFIRFVADPQCIYRVYKYAEERGMDIAVLIHSHPASPYPSNLDLKGMELWDIPWIIVDSRTGSVKAWILKNGELREVHIETV